MFTLIDLSGGVGLQVIYSPRMNLAHELSDVCTIDNQDSGKLLDLPVWQHGC